MRRTAAAFAAVMTAFGAAFAQISPGPLAQAHAGLEGIAKCTACHKLGREVSDELCLTCHRTINSRRASGLGYHNSPEVTVQKCAQCHPDHSGREFEMINYPNGELHFDHSLTGWPLKGGHMRLQCAECHKPAWVNPAIFAGDSTVNPKTTKLGLTSACTACHEDEHRGQLSAACRNCHDETAWRPAPRFSHDSTSYPLTGRHNDTDCSKCHKPQPAPAVSGHLIRESRDPEHFALFKGIQFTGCVDCHKDVHKGRLGTQCEKCHQTDTFKRIYFAAFNHDLTDYPLTGLHQSVDCAKCHKSHSMTDELAFAACRDCHSDEHRGQFSSRPDQGACETCHDTFGFTPSRFGIAEHNRTDFPITGSHLAVPCAGCHKPAEPEPATAKFVFETTNCRDCHADPHRGEADKWRQSGDCAYCHETEDFRSPINFDHNLSKLPLVGKHETTPCSKCHRVASHNAEPALLVLYPLKTECHTCHSDIHQGQFNPIEGKPVGCDRCHSPVGWGELLFDHNRDSKFKLEGAHQRVSCRQCHKVVITGENQYFVQWKSTPTDCASCHGPELNHKKLNP